MKERTIESLLNQSTIKKLRKLGKENGMEDTPSGIEKKFIDTSSGMYSFEFEFHQKRNRWVTIAYVTCIHFDRGYHSLLTGISICNPEDVFDPEIGRTKALTHALDGLTKEQRASVWSSYNGIKSDGVPTAMLSKVYKHQSDKKTSS